MRALVIGPTYAVRRAWPDTLLDVVGTSPDDEEVTVVSEADGAASLPRRWDCVVVTDPDPRPERLVAAALACLPRGVVIVLGTGSTSPDHPVGTEVEHRAHSGDLRLVVARVGQ